MPSALRLAKNAIPTQRESHWNGRVNPGRDAVGGTRSNPTAKALGISFICDNLPSPTVSVAWRATPMTALFLHTPIPTMHAPIREPTRWQNDNSTSPGSCRRAMARRPGGGTGPAQQRRRALDDARPVPRPCARAGARLLRLHHHRGFLDGALHLSRARTTPICAMPPARPSSIPPCSCRISRRRPSISASFRRSRSPSTRRSCSRGWSTRSTT